jgi:signal transduction histidine kinase
MALASPPRSTTVDASVTGHRYRPGGRGQLWSVRTQLLTPIVVALLAFVALGVVQTRDAIVAANDASRARVLAETATTTARLVHELERENAEAAALRDRGGKAGEKLVTGQQGRVNEALKDFRSSANDTRSAAPELRPALDAAEAQVNSLPTARTAQEQARAAVVYLDITTSLLAVADALAPQLQDPDLAAAAREVATIVGIEQLASLERDLLRPIFSRKSMAPGELAQLALLHGAREQREADFTRVAGTSSRDAYQRLISGTDVDNADKMIRGALDSNNDPNSPAVKVDPDAWYVAQSNTIRRINLLSLTLSDRLDEEADDTATATTRTAIATGALTLAVAVLVLSVATYLAVRISRRLRRLRAAAFTVARHELPNAINTVSLGGSPDAVVKESAAQVLTQRLSSDGDEVGEVAEAFVTVHRAALRLAAEQAELRVDLSRMAEVLARRIRTLVERQLRLLDEFERTETDPAELARLFALDHLAARMRRNGENLLVLAGGEPSRGATGEYPLGVVVTAAAGEIEQYARVQVNVEQVQLSSAVIGDLMHLLAELLENATNFSPPETQVYVDARRTLDGVTVRVHDRGVGISPQRLDAINRRLARPAALSSAAAGTMGLHVVSRLASRHGFLVELMATGDGTVAYVHLPRTALAGGDGLPRALIAPEPHQQYQPQQQQQPQLPEVSLSGPPTLEIRPFVRSRQAEVAAASTVGAMRPGGVATDAGRGNGFPGSLPTPPRQPDVAAGRRTPVTVGAQPMQPAQAARSPLGPVPVAPAAPPQEPDGLLPRRRPGQAYDPSADPAAPPETPAAPRSGMPGLIDPNSVRARLSALSEGVTAAQRRTGNR